MREGGGDLYRQLRGLMAKYSVNVSGLSVILKVTYQTASKKINGHTDFTLTEARKIKEYFASKGEKADIEDIFFTQVSI